MTRVEQLKKVQAEGLELFTRKNADYGDAFAKYGVIGVLMRIEDKIQRTLSISKTGVNLIESESIRDTMIDLHNYAGMAIMLLDEKKDYVKEEPRYSITFSIPECKITKISIFDIMSKKKKILSSLIPGRTETYIYTTEIDYYQEYQNSLFARTNKKSGWDCLRHYEIMANGCIPYFPDIDNCPINTMAFCPKHLFYKGNVLYDRLKDKSVENLSSQEKDECTSLIEELLNFIKENLTTEKIAQYILRTCGKPAAQNILVLSGNTDPDYLRCLTLHGLKTVLKEKCHEYPIIPHIYKSNIDPNTLYGRGFTYSNLLDPEEYYNSSADETVESDICNRKYDLVIYGSFTRGMPLYDLVREHYKPDEIVLLFGEDSTIDHYSHIYRDPLNPIFIREW